MTTNRANSASKTRFGTLLGAATGPDPAGPPAGRCRLPARAGRGLRRAGHAGLALAVVAGLTALLPHPAAADSGGAVIDLSDSATPSGDGWSYAGGVFTIDGSAEVTVTGATATNRVVVSSSATATVTLDNASIDATSLAGASAFDITGSTVALKISGANTLLSSGKGAALNAPKGSAIKITSAAGDGSAEGVLNAANTSVGTDGAGIGGGNGQAGGSIAIAGGTVNAAGSYYGAG
ncbi:MAG: hypothetical protein LBD51_08010, partial [Bifidobacteriaceae bacterium]|nr:hypothetical protein [Bifidobacteriaceae bacterium]